MEKQELFEELQKILMEENQPSIAVNELSQKSEFKEYPFNLINGLKGVKQSERNHPEGDVWIHTMMVVDQAAKVREQSSDPVAFMWAALLHDIGKPETTAFRHGKITSYDHDVVGEDIARKFLNEFHLEKQWIESVVAMVRWHMHILYVVKNLPYGDIKTLRKEGAIKDIGLIGWCDRMGRGGANSEEVRNDIEQFYNICNSKQ